MPGNRKRTRLEKYDYSTPGAYFITICSQGHKCIFGSVNQGRFLESEWGSVVLGAWESLPRHFPSIELDKFQLMPNHLHGIVVIKPHSESCKPGSLPTIIGNLKSYSSQEINKLRGKGAPSVWQRGFYDRVVRPEEEINSYRQCILDNPEQWELDKLNPKNMNQGRSLTGPYE